MARLLKTQVLQQTKYIKQLLLNKQPFEGLLAQLYTQLRLQAKYNWMIQTYQLLALYVPADKQSLLYHPALLQAFISQGNLQQATQIAHHLFQKNPKDPEVIKFIQGLQNQQDNALAPYTPLGTLSRYDSSRSKRGSRKKPLLPHTIQQKLEQITPERLESFGYAQKHKQLARLPKPHRETAQQLFDELALNYLFSLHRAVVVLAGALLELLISVHICHTIGKKHIHTANNQNKAVFDCTLNDLLFYANQTKILPEKALRLCRAARLQRNLIHPGKEIAERTALRAGGSQICLLAVLETIDALF